jgi:hypothetical protein
MPFSALLTRPSFSGPPIYGQERPEFQRHLGDSNRSRSLWSKVFLGVKRILLWLSCDPAHHDAARSTFSSRQTPFRYHPGLGSYLDVHACHKVVYWHVHQPLLLVGSVLLFLRLVIDCFC